MPSRKVFIVVAVALITIGLLKTRKAYAGQTQAPTTGDLGSYGPHMKGDAIGYGPTVGGGGFGEFNGSHNPRGPAPVILPPPSPGPAPVPTPSVPTVGARQYELAHITMFEIGTPLGPGHTAVYERSRLYRQAGGPILGSNDRDPQDIIVAGVIGGATKGPVGTVIGAVGSAFGGGERPSLQAQGWRSWDELTPMQQNDLRAYAPWMGNAEVRGHEARNPLLVTISGAISHVAPTDPALLPAPPKPSENLVPGFEPVKTIMPIGNTPGGRRAISL